jgi:DNA topoisomerase VI subunit B
MDFFSEQALVKQTGHGRDEWPLVVLKELTDNSIDATEEKRPDKSKMPPEVAVRVNGEGVCVTDNGPGISAETVESVKDFAVRVSSREAYISPCRGAQGNALKTIIALPFVLSGQQQEGVVEIAACGKRHQVTVKMNRLRQRPLPAIETADDESVKSGTSVLVRWPQQASLLEHAKNRFLPLAEDFAILNPHLTLTVDWFGERYAYRATNTEWKKWTPDKPTSAHWYDPSDFERLVIVYLTEDEEKGRDRPLRDFLGEFKGLASTVLRSNILEELGMSRLGLSALRKGDDIDTEMVCRLLAAMKVTTSLVEPSHLGAIGKKHIRERFEALGCEMESFVYHKDESEEGVTVPWVLEAAFAWHPDLDRRRLVTGVNWSPGIINPFRQLGRCGVSLDSILEGKKAGPDEPIVLLLHVTSPKPIRKDAGKSSIVISD